jgi:hypothetical protein
MLVLCRKQCGVNFLVRILDYLKRIQKHFSGESLQMINTWVDCRGPETEARVHAVEVSWFAHSHVEADPVVSWKHDHIGFGCGGNFAHVPHTKQDNHWGWLCCCSFEFGSSQQGRVTGGEGCCFMTLLTGQEMLSAIMGSSGLEELNHLATVQSWSPLIISCFETRGTLAWSALSLWFEEQEKGFTSISSVLAKWRMCVTQGMLYI